MKNIGNYRGLGCHLVFVGVLATTSAALATTYDFESDIAGSGWWVSPSTSTQNAWSTDMAESGTHSLKTVDGMWVSPGEPVLPGDYLRVSGWINASGSTGGMWGTDTNSVAPYPTGPGWTHVDFAARQLPGRTATSALFGAPTSGAVYLDNLSIAPATRAEAKQAFQNLYATMPAFDFKAAVSTHAVDQLPQTMGMLKAGQSPTVVLLGDSIVNDTSSSGFETQLEGVYPGRMNIVTSTRGSTGCWYYKDPTQLQSYVLQYNPDLVVIGGISHDTSTIHNDTQDIASVIDQIRAASPKTEILLLTESAGSNNAYLNPALAQPLDPNGTDWRAALYQLSQQEHTGFLDMTQTWAQYELASGQPDAWFHRDPIHDNAYGEAVEGRTLSSYFMPLAPEPGTLALAACAAGMLLSRRAGRKRS